MKFSQTNSFFYVMKDNPQVNFCEKMWQKCTSGNLGFNQQMGNWRVAQGKMKLTRSYQMSYQSNILAKSGRLDGRTEFAVFQKKRVLTESYGREKNWKGMSFTGQNHQVREENPRNDFWHTGKIGKWECDLGMRNEILMCHGKRNGGRGWGGQMKRGKGGHGPRGRPYSRKWSTGPRMTLDELDKKLAAYTINTDDQPDTDINVGISRIEGNLIENMEIDMPIVESSPEAEM
ncbi:Hypothetical predicted protein [Pelobates cultripes]|uniref:Chromatin target of PRMT1 protein C-terminal domain-containing protein n=1 Tax=Pelobates cultripes TaxID=61616 RepID=A0AAD1SM77_PELCU|nr:Hypothetical predicted protein [Pelobates cultripes]